MSSAKTPTPFLKWAGGKHQLLRQLAPLLPAQWGQYHEPFLGGGAVYFFLASQGEITTATLSDVNPELVNCYVAVRDEVGGVVRNLRRHAKAHCGEYYYKMRAMDPSGMSVTARAARTIYLNKTCYNGLYRVNSRGWFNVPIGSYKKPAICDDGSLRLASSALMKTLLRVANFRSVLEVARHGDFVYLDPPYMPVSDTASFTAYSSGRFDESCHRELADVYGELDARGCFVMLSNSEVPLVRTLYAKWRIEAVSARRIINCDATSRGPITELVVLNYDPVGLPAARQGEFPFDRTRSREQETGT